MHQGTWGGKKQVTRIACTRWSGWDIYHIDVDVCMFTEFCKRHFDVKLFYFIFDTLFSIFFELLRTASILLDPIFTGDDVFIEAGVRQ